MSVKGTVRATIARAWIRVPDLRVEDALLLARAVKETARVATAARRVVARAVTDEVRVVGTDRPLGLRQFADIGRQETASTASLAVMPTLTK